MHVDWHADDTRLIQQKQQGVAHLWNESSFQLCLQRFYKIKRNIPFTEAHSERFSPRMKWLWCCCYICMREDHFMKRFHFLFCLVTSSFCAIKSSIWFLFVVVAPEVFSQLKTNFVLFVPHRLEAGWACKGNATMWICFIAVYDACNTQPVIFTAASEYRLRFVLGQSLFQIIDCVSVKWKTNKPLAGRVNTDHMSVSYLMYRAADTVFLLICPHGSTCWATFPALY